MWKKSVIHLFIFLEKTIVSPLNVWDVLRYFDIKNAILNTSNFFFNISLIIESVT